MRSIVLFVHVVGMVVLFIGLAVEWLSLESLRRSTDAAQASSWVRLHSALPRVYGVASALLLLSGIYLAATLGVFGFAWVRVSLALMVLMAILGGPAVRSRVRAIHEAAAHEREVASALRRNASNSWLRASLFMRVAMGLAAVYLMIGKPLLNTSMLVTGGAVAVGVAVSMRRVFPSPSEDPQGRAQATRGPLGPTSTRGL
jgi:uncharacterized membrane protein SirB2